MEQSIYDKLRDKIRIRFNPETEQMDIDYTEVDKEYDLLKQIKDSIVLNPVKFNNLNFEKELAKIFYDRAQAIKSNFFESEKVDYGTDEDGDKLKLAAEILSQFAPRICDIYPGATYTPPYSSSRNDPMHFHLCHPTRFTDGKGELSTYAMGDVVKRESKCPQLIKLSEANVKQVKNVENIKHIDEFFYAVDEDDNLTCSFYLRMYYIAHTMDVDRIQPFFESLKEINPLFGKIYEILDTVHDKLSYKLKGKSHEVINEVLTRLNKMAALEYVCMTSPDDKEAIAKAAGDLFMLSDIPGAKIRLPGFEALLSFYKDFTESSQYILSHMALYKFEEENTKREIQLYLKAKGLLEMTIPVDELNEFESFISLNL